MMGLLEQVLHALRVVQREHDGAHDRDRRNDHDQHQRNRGDEIAAHDAVGQFIPGQLRQHFVHRGMCGPRFRLHPFKAGQRVA